VESLTFRTLGRNRASLQLFVDDVVRCHIKRQGVPRICMCTTDGWDNVEGYSRACDSVVLEREKRTLAQDVAQFRDRSNDTSVWEFLTIVAICFTDRLEREDIAGVRTAAHFGCPSTLSTFRILLMQV